MRRRSVDPQASTAGPPRTAPTLRPARRAVRRVAHRARSHPRPSRRPSTRSARDGARALRGRPRSRRGGRVGVGAGRRSPTSTRPTRATGARSEGALARGGALPPPRPRRAPPRRHPPTGGARPSGSRATRRRALPPDRRPTTSRRWSATSSWSVRGTRSGSSSVDSAVVGHRARELEREVGVAAGRGGDAGQHRSRRRDVEPLAHEVVQRPQRERADHQHRQPLLRERAPQPERGIVCFVCSDRREHPRRSFEPAGCELEHAARRAVEPLRVVDRDDDRPVGRERCEHAGECRRDESCLGRLVRRLAQQRRGERALLHGWQGAARLVEALADEVRQRGVRKARLRLRRARTQHAVAAPRRVLDAARPQSRLADPRRAGEHERARRLGDRVEVPSDRVQLVCP